VGNGNLQASIIPQLLEQGANRPPGMRHWKGGSASLLESAPWRMGTGIILIRIRDDCPR
jgi:hypothetical protein